MDESQMKLGLLKFVFGTLMSCGFITIAEAQSYAEMAQIMEPIFKIIAYCAAIFSGFATGYAVFHNIFFRKGKKDDSRES